MIEWLDIAIVADFPPGTHRVVHASYEAVIVVNVDGEFYAVKDICSHDGGILSNGQLIGDELICPRHGARFCVKTGEALTPPAYDAIDTYPLRVKDGIVQLQIDI